MNDKIYADINEILSITRNANESIDALKTEIGNLKEVYSELESMESPSYLDKLGDELTDFSSKIDSELLENIANLYEQLEIITDSFVELDNDMAKGY